MTLQPLAVKSHRAPLTRRGSRVGIQRRVEKKGFVILTVAFSVLLIIGMLGLTVDLGRIYIHKNELQAYVDAATAAANQELDGTDAGIERARNVASTYPNSWNFSTAPVTNPVVTFAEDRDGPYVAYPPSPPKDYRFIRVDVSGDVPLYFMSILTGATAQPAPVGFLLTFQVRTASLEADSAAGQFKLSRFDNHLVPYSPDAHLDAGRPPVTNPGFAEPDPFNFVIGKQYTMRWPPPGQRDKPGSWCEGDRDANFVSPDPSSQRGFIDIGDMPGSGGSAYIRQAIISNVQSHPLTLGEPVVHVAGNRGVESEALRDRVNQDTDPSAATWDQYQENRLNEQQRVGNGRRVVFLPVNNPFDEDRIVEFGTFFLPEGSDVCGNSNVAPCCAEYIGPGLLFGRKAASQTAGVYRTRLLQ